MRNTFIEILTEKAKHDKSIVLIVGDLGFNVVEPFAKKFPDRFINIGIAEQNMIGVAAGLAKEGHNVFATSFAPFLTLRSGEQIRMNLGYMKLNGSSCLLSFNTIGRPTSDLLSLIQN